MAQTRNQIQFYVIAKVTLRRKNIAIKNTQKEYKWMLRAFKFMSKKKNKPQKSRNDEL